MIVTLTSARGGTGVTAAAVGLAAVWPRPVLLVEADPCGYSAILAGTLAASVPAGAGVLDAAMAARAGQLSHVFPGMLVALPGTNARVLPGLASVAHRAVVVPAVIGCPAANGAAATTTGAVPDTIPNRAAAPATDTTMMPTAAATSFAFTAGRTDRADRGATGGSGARVGVVTGGWVGVVVIRTSGRCPGRWPGWW